MGSLHADPNLHSSRSHSDEYILGGLLLVGLPRGGTSRPICDVYLHIHIYIYPSLHPCIDALQLHYKHIHTELIFSCTNIHIRIHDMNQHNITKTIKFDGIALHSNRLCYITLHGYMYIHACIHYITLYTKMLRFITLHYHVRALG